MKKLFILVAVIGLFSCDYTNNDKVMFETFRIQSPFKNIDVVFETFSILNEKGGGIELADGGYIKVPLGAFSNDSGLVLNGGVEIKFRGFKNPAEIIASGIPMNYDSAGTSNDFQSAGMYEIRAYQNGKEVSVTNGKQIEVAIASSRPDANYNFYDLKEDGNWDYNFTCKPKENPLYLKKIEDFKKSLIAKEPIKPNEANDSTPVFDLKYKKNSFPELSAFGNVLWTPFKKQLVIKELRDLGAENVKIVKNDRYEGVYNLVFTSNNQEKKLIAQPVFIGDDFDNALEKFETNLDAYKKEWASKQIEINRLLNEQKFLRVSKISGMGVYNYDRIYHRSDAIFVNANFKIRNQPEIQIKQVYLISNRRDLVIYSKDRFSKFGFPSSDENVVVTILKNDAIGYCKINRNKIINEHYEVDMIVAEDQFTSVDDITLFIESL